MERQRRYSTVPRLISDDVAVKRNESRLGPVLFILARYPRLLSEHHFRGVIHLIKWSADSCHYRVSLRQCCKRISRLLNLIQLMSSVTHYTAQDRGSSLNKKEDIGLLIAVECNNVFFRFDPATAHGRWAGEGGHGLPNPARYRCAYNSRSHSSKPNPCRVYVKRRGDWPHCSTINLLPQMILSPDTSLDCRCFL